LVVLAALAVAAWFTRSFWMPFLDRDDTTAETAALPTWQPLTTEGARRAEAELQRLQQPRGPMYVTTSAGDLASYIVNELTRALPASTDSIEAAAIGDQLHVRALVRTAELGTTRELGPLAALLGERERLELAGTIRVIRPGLSELQVKQIRVRDLSIPSALIPNLVRQIVRGERTEGLSPDGIPLRTPDYIADVRVQNGMITLYKPAPPAPAKSR
jgi:hypothetical protein